MLNTKTKIKKKHQYQGVRGKYSDSFLLSFEDSMTNWCGLVRVVLHLTDSSLNTEYGANRNSRSPLTSVLVTIDMCCTRYLWKRFPLRSNLMLHSARGWSRSALCAKLVATRRLVDVAKNPGTRYFLPRMESKNGRQWFRKLPPLHVSP